MTGRRAGRLSRLRSEELRWAATFAAIVMLLTTVPYLAAVATQAQADTWRFGGFLLAVEDGNSYIAKMGQGARGAWLYRLAYSSDPQRGAFVFGLHLLLGRLAGPDHDRLVVAYHLARVVFGAALLVVSYVFLAEFLPLVRQRRLGLVLVALGGGLGWLLALLSRSPVWDSLPVDFISPEAYTFLVLYGLPHLAAARCLFLLGLLAYLRSRGIAAGLAFLGLSFIQPLSVVVAWVIMGVATALDWAGHLRQQQVWRRGMQVANMRAVPRTWERIPQPLVRRLLVVPTAVLLSSPLILYTVYAFNVDPVLRQWNAQNVLPSPHPFHYLLGYGVLMAFGALGWRVLWRRRPVPARFIGSWLVAALLLLYVPIPPQRRLIEGLQLPLVVLAVMGVTVALRRFRPWGTLAALALSVPTTALLLMGGVAVARSPAEPIFHPADQLAAFDWLARHAQPGQVGLSAYEIGNALPAYTPLVAYIGHGPETVFLAEKAPRVARFYQSATSDSERRRLLAEGRIDFVLFGPHERALGDFDPHSADYLRWQFESGDYTIYKVTP